MSKEKNKQKETNRKAPEKSLKEKRAVKKAKQESRKNS